MLGEETGKGDDLWGTRAAQDVHRNRTQRAVGSDPVGFILTEGSEEGVNENPMDHER